MSAVAAAHWAHAWVGVPYGDLGRGPEAYDCWGLVRGVFAEHYGIDVPSYADEYCSSRAGAAIESVIDRECLSWRPVAAAAEGDVVVLRVLGRRMHCGVMLDADRFLHVLFGCRGCIERLSDAVWRRRVEGIYRHRRLA